MDQNNSSNQSRRFLISQIISEITAIWFSFEISARKIASRAGDATPILFRCGKSNPVNINHSVAIDRLSQPKKNISPTYRVLLPRQNNFSNNESYPFQQFSDNNQPKQYRPV